MAEDSESQDYEGKHVAVGLKRDYLLPDVAYNVLKNSSLYVFPALAALYATLAAIWGLPHADEVTKTVVAVDTCIGIVLGISKRSYSNSEAKYAGDLMIKKLEDDQVGMGVALNAPLDYKNTKEVTFRVNAVE